MELHRKIMMRCKKSSVKYNKYKRFLFQTIALDRKRGVLLSCTNCGYSTSRNYQKLLQKQEIEEYQRKIKLKRQIEANQTAMVQDRRFEKDPEEDAWLEGRI